MTSLDGFHQALTPLSGREDDDLSLCRMWTSGLYPRTTPEGYSDRWTLIFSVLISVFTLSTVSLWWRPAACVFVFLTSRPLNKVSVGVRRQSVPGTRLSASLRGALWDCWFHCQQDQREQQSSIWPCLLSRGHPWEMRKKLFWLGGRKMLPGKSSPFLR